MPPTPARPSPSPGGWRSGATTAAWPSSTCATPAASCRSSRATRCSPGPPTTCATSTSSRSSARSRARDERNVNPDLPTGEVEVVASRIEVLNASAPLPFQVDERVTVGEEARLKHRYLDLRRPGAHSAGHAIRLRSKVNAAARRVLDAARLRRDRDADADPLDPRGRPRLPRARAARARLLVRPAAEPAAVQAAAHGGRHGALLPDRPLLPRRGLPRRPAARVHPARHRDELRRAGRRARARRGRGRARSGSSSASSCRRRSRR